MKKISDGLIHYRRSSESSSITSSSAGSVYSRNESRVDGDDDDDDDEPPFCPRVVIMVITIAIVKHHPLNDCIKIVSFQVDFFQFNNLTPAPVETLLKVENLLTHFCQFLVTIKDQRLINMCHF